MSSTSTPLWFDVAQFAILIGSVILHEVSHGWAALALGDDTAKRSGRLTLNPLPHLDPVGSILVPGLLLLSGTGILFGWAKPVPVNVGRLRHPRNDAVLTSLAGPATNIVLVACAIAVLRIAHPSPGYFQINWTWELLMYFGLINLWLAAFNLLPVPPLDGSAVVERLIPDRHFGRYLALRPYTMLLVFAVVILGERTTAAAHVFNFLFAHLASLAGY